MQYADFLGFLSAEGAKPVLDPKVDTSSLRLVHLTSAPPYACTLQEVLIYHHQFVWELVRQADRIKIVLDSDGLLADNRLGVVLGLQNMPENVDVELLYSAGIRIIGIAYERANYLGGGFAEEGVGLTDYGREVLAACAEQKIIVDLAHTNHQTARDVLDFIKEEKIDLSIVASHIGCWEVYNHPRNLPMDVLRGIVECGGVVGIYTLTFGLHPYSNSLDPFLEHLRFALNICGQNNVCIGSDGHYCHRDLENWRRNFIALSKKLDTKGKFNPRFPTQPLELNKANRMEVLYEYLSGANIFSQEVIEKVFFKNLIRFLRNNLPET